MTLPTRPNDKHLFTVATSLMLGSLLSVAGCAESDLCAPHVLQKPYTAGLEFEDSSAAFSIYTNDLREVRASVVAQGSYLVASFTEMDSLDQITASVDTQAAPETVNIEALASYNESSDFSYGLWVVWTAQVGESASERITKLSLMHPTENGYTLELSGWQEDRSYAVATSTSRDVFLAEIDHQASGDNLTILTATFPYYEELPEVTPTILSRMPVEGVQVSEMHRLTYDEIDNSFELIGKFDDGTYQEVQIDGYCPQPIE